MIPLYKIIFIFGGVLLTTCSVQAQKKYTLRQALEKARIENPELQTEQYEIGFAESDLITSKLHLNPTFEFEPVQMIRNSDFEEGTSWSDARNREVFYQISKPFKWFGQRKNTIAVAQKELDISESNYADTERKVFYDVALQWLEVWEAQKQVALINSAKLNIDSLTKINEKRYAYEVISQTDLARTKLLAKQYTIDYKTAQTMLKNKKKKLGRLLGSDEAAAIKESADFLFDHPSDKERLLQQALQGRSDIHSAENKIDLAESNVELQKSLAIPQPELGVVYNPMGAVPFLGVSLAIDLPFFDQNQGERKKSTQLKKQAETALKEQQKQVRTEVEIAYSKLYTQQENLKESEELLKQAETILDNIKQTYLKGETTIIDFLEAQRSWLEVQQQYYEVKYAYRKNKVRLLYAAGLFNQLAL